MTTNIEKKKPPYMSYKGTNEILFFVILTWKCFYLGSCEAHHNTAKMLAIGHL